MARPKPPQPTPRRPKTARNPRGAGAPTKQTVERRTRILAALQAGGTRKASCEAAGISEDTFANWLKNSSDFSDAVTQAEAACELRMTVLIYQAAATDAKHAQWWLERRRGREYGQRSRLDINVQAEAERLAAELGLNPRELLEEAQRIATAAWHR